jgi:hypothetical protein
MTNAHSKKREPLAAAVALHFMWYNFCRVHETLRVTPAMENGLAGHVWTVEELVVAALAEPVPAPPPPMPGEQLDMFIDRPSKAAAAKRTALRLIRGGKASAVEETEEESAPDTVRGTGRGLLEEGSEGVGELPQYPPEADNAGKRARIPEAERREPLTQIVLCRTKLSASEALLLREVFPEILASHHDQV